MKIWTVSEAYCDANDGYEISSYVELAKTAEDARKILTKMMKERIEENFVRDCDYDDENELNHRREIVMQKIIDSNAGDGWYRYEGDYETVSWNVSVKDLDF